MEIIKTENLTFTYPESKVSALSDISFSVHAGEFITVCGKSGCGKSTLLRLLKPTISPHGIKTGLVFFKGNDIYTLSQEIQCSAIGFVQQSPENQIVCDKVWHELAFGLESLGLPNSEIRSRVAEMASFFGIQTWFHKTVTELSGGQKQLLSLASVMVMQPSLILLDEPTSRLDPIAAHEFLETLSKLNRELGVSVILTEHRLEEAFSLSDRIIVMDNGRIISDSAPYLAGENLKQLNHDMFDAMPAPVRIHSAVKNNLKCPITVREGRSWLLKIAKQISINPALIPKSIPFSPQSPPIIELDNVWFRYEKNLPDTIKGLSMKIYKGEIFSIVGGNGVGKTTALSLIGGLLSPYRGEIFIKGKNINKIKDHFCGCIGFLPQNPQTLFVKKTVELDLYEMLKEQKISDDEKRHFVEDVISVCDLSSLRKRHPYDLSGGEQQRAALAKILLLSPDILLLDEPTKGIDAHFKRSMANILFALKQAGKTIVLVSHDIEFCAEFSDRCAMFFDGNAVGEGISREFFCGKSFYTTSVNRMARDILPSAVLASDVIIACGGEVSKQKITKLPLSHDISKENFISPKKSFNSKLIFRIFLSFFYIIALTFIADKYSNIRKSTAEFLTLLFTGLGLTLLNPRKRYSPNLAAQTKKEVRRLTKRTLSALFIAVFLIPFTIYVGIYILDDKKYYFISLLIILETFLPFFIIFEKRKPQARELIIISVLCAIAVAGRAAFYMFPQFKPILSIVIIAGVAFGGEAGFLTGAISGFVSNFFYGQGPWTPWQMFALGISGFIGGILFRRGIIRKTRLSLCIYGAFAAFIIYGGIMNPASVIMMMSQIEPTKSAFLSAYIMGIPLDFVHAASTVFFMWFISEPFLEKLDRIKIKYGLLS